MTRKYWGLGLLAGVMVLGGCGPAEDLDDLEEEEVTEEANPDLGKQEAPLPGFGERTQGFLASADARLDSRRRETPLGGATRMRIDGSPDSVSLLRFDVGPLSSPVVSAKIRLYASAPSHGTPELYLAPGDWSEATVTWKTRPKVTGAPVAVARPVPDDAWVEFDVTDVITQGGIYNFELKMPSSDGASFITRESTLYALVPQLLIDTEPNNCRAGPVLTNEARWPDQTVTVSEARPDERLIRQPRMKVGGAPREEAYLRFGVDHRGRTLASAKLRLWAESATADGPALYEVPADAWGGDTWNSRPTPGATPLADVGAVRAGTWVEYDVTDALKDRTGPHGSTHTGFDFDVALLPSGADGVAFTSAYDRYVTHRPHLALTYAVECPNPIPDGQ